MDAARATCWRWGVSIHRARPPAGTRGAASASASAPKPARGVPSEWHAAMSTPCATRPWAQMPGPRCWEGPQCSPLILSTQARRSPGQRSPFRRRATGLGRVNNRSDLLHAARSRPEGRGTLHRDPEVARDLAGFATPRCRAQSCSDHRIGSRLAATCASAAATGASRRSARPPNAVPCRTQKRFAPRPRARHAPRTGCRGGSWHSPPCPGSRALLLPRAALARRQTAGHPAAPRRCCGPSLEALWAPCCRRAAAATHYIRLRAPAPLDASEGGDAGAPAHAARAAVRVLRRRRRRARASPATTTFKMPVSAQADSNADTVCTRDGSPPR